MNFQQKDLSDQVSLVGRSYDICGEEGTNQKTWSGLQMTQDGIIVNPKNVVSVVEWDRLSTTIDVCIFFVLLDIVISLQSR